MTDSFKLDDKEKITILFKNYLSVPSTDDKKDWFEEQSINYSNYVKDENILIDNIPDKPIWTYKIKAEEIGLSDNDFYNYVDNDNTNILNNSIIEDSTRIIRKYKNLKLDVLDGTTIPGQCWIKFDNSNNNILKDSLEFNLKKYLDTNRKIVQPYQYFLYSSNYINEADVILNDETGGNWLFDTRSGLLFFPDFENFTNLSNSVIQDRNRINVSNNNPLLTFYNYIGRKGIKSNFNILQIANLNYNTNLSNIIIGNFDSFDILNDISLNLKAIKANSNYKVTINFNYLASTYTDTLLEVALCYRLNEGSEFIIGHYILGTENTNFNYQLFSTSFYEKINCDLNTILNFYLKAKIKSNNNHSEYSQDFYNNLEEIDKPSIIFNKQGNSFIVEEINN